MKISEPRASIIIPVRDSLVSLGKTLESVLNADKGKEVEVIIINDGQNAGIEKLAKKYPVNLVPGNGGGAAAARNLGIKKANGSLLLFLDADCRVSRDWITIHLKAHESGDFPLVVGGSIALEPEAPLWARCDHYCCWYNVNPGRPASWVPNHPAANMSMSRDTFEAVGWFKEDLPMQGVHEETEWQARLKDVGGRILFEPKALVWHTDRNDFCSFLRHNFRWGYNSLQVKRGTAVSRFPRLYRNPRMLILNFFPFAAALTAYSIILWVKAGKAETLAFSPIIFLGHLSYAIGMVMGGIHARIYEKQF